MRYHENLGMKVIKFSCKGRYDQNEKVMKVKKLFFFIAFLCLILASSGGQEYWLPEVISVVKNPDVEKKLREKGFDFLMEWNNRVYVIVDVKDFQELDKENISFIRETFNLAPCIPRDISAQGGVNGDYHSYAELERELFALEDSYPSLASVSRIGESLEGRNIYALKISDNVGLDEDEAEVLFIGCHHAREWISVEVPLLLGKHLLTNYETDGRIKSVVDQSEIWIVPLLNPDGLEYSIHFYRYWRKNRRDNGDSSYGVDLNRNYGYMWGFDNQGSSHNPNSEVYRGAEAFSEPETQAIRDLFSERNLQSMISYHSYSQVIIYPWGYTTEPTSQDQLLSQIAAAMSGLIQSVNGNVYEYGQGVLYLTNGDATDWSFGVYGIPSYTIELPPLDYLGGGFFNAESDIQFIFAENLPAVLYLIEWSVQNFSPTLDFSRKKARENEPPRPAKDEISRGRRVQPPPTEQGEAGARIKTKSSGLKKKNKHIVNDKNRKGLVLHSGELKKNSPPGAIKKR